MNPEAVSRALCRSLIESPLLVGDLPEADAFPHRTLQLPDRPSLQLAQKLGHLCEDALALLLKATPRFDLLARNLQIRQDAHNTLGELDFLVRDLDSGQLVHLELATKFYLAVETGSGLALPGPDARDSYFKKQHRLRTHQLLLSSKYQRNLPAPYRDEPIIPQQLIHGCLFDHVLANRPATPEGVAPACRRGRWLRLPEMGDHFAPGASFQIIPKPLWPVPPDRLEGLALDRWTPPSTIDRCVMLRVGGEPLPYFVTPASYPGTGDERSQAVGASASMACE